MANSAGELHMIYLVIAATGYPEIRIDISTRIILLQDYVDYACDCI